MTASAERDYVLGTHDDELKRLGLQHRVWRSMVHDAWRRAGITRSSRVLDVGCGPGYATSELAEIVGSGGEVIAVERSSQFVQSARSLCAQPGHQHVRICELDLMTDEIPAQAVDAAWCRWVASFVSSPATLVARIARSLRPGGVAVFHEYLDYASWRLAPPRPRVEAFVQQVMASWRAGGGEPDVAPSLIDALLREKFTIREAVPRVFCVRPHDEAWQWPASFLDVNLKRLVALGRVEEEWAQAVRQEFCEAAANPHSLMCTPLVLEIIAERSC